MLAYLVNFIAFFLPVSLAAGLLIAVRMPAGGEKGMRSIAVALVCGLLTGSVIYLVSRQQEAVTAARTWLHATALLAALLHGALLVLPGRRSGALSAIGQAAAACFAATLTAAATFSFAGFVAGQALSASAVLNTELIVNVGGIAAGLSLVVFLIPLTAVLGAKGGKGVAKALLLLVSLLLAGQWAGDILLGLMRLELLELTSLRVSLVAKIAKYGKLFPYFQALLIAAIAILFFHKRTKITPLSLDLMGKAERRKARGRVMLETRWFRSALASVLFIFALLCYHDLYASRPPRISKPLPLKPDAAGEIRVRTGDLADGRLHRYAYVTADGRVVRFFMITSLGGKKIGVVYDACMLCGDMGYLQVKNEVICIACNVRIFTPSIGKTGGCNPIPLPHRLEGEDVVVAAEELDKGAKYFSQVAAAPVKEQ